MREWMFQIDAEQKKDYKNAREVMEVTVDGELLRNTEGKKKVNSG